MDHPRSRGVYCCGTAAPSSWAGSSPLARGLLRAHGAPGSAAGIIPARAGFTVGRRPARRRRRDHPRSRGVYPSKLPGPPMMWGSSPLARGLLVSVDPGVPLDGIIPARAGFTCTTTGPNCPTRDHPRSRGVYATSDQRYPQLGGSSPLARGLLTAPVDAGGVIRIIPARAGFTSGRRSAPSSATDHPRSRGVYPCRSRRTPCRSGSSPLARGLRAVMTRPP